MPTPAFSSSPTSTSSPVASAKMPSPTILLQPTRDAPSLSACPSTSSEDEPESSPRQSKDASGKRKADQVEDLDASDRPKKRVPAQIWEDMRPLFTKLYQEERKPLKECMAIMEKEYNFVATVKMYKSRVWKWGLDKKLKGDEVLAMLILLDQRKKLNKHRTSFMIRKQPVDMDNVKRYLKRNPSLMVRYQAGNVPSVQTSHEVECYTPGSSPRLMPAPMPYLGGGGGGMDSYGSHGSHGYGGPAEPYQVEKLLNLVRDYVDMSFATGKWRCRYDVSCTSSMAGDRSEELFERVIASFALVNRYLVRGDQISINAVLDPAFESLKEIVGTESPIFLVRTVCLLWYLDRQHKHDMQRIVIDYLGGLIPIVLHGNPIMTHIWHILCSTDFSDYFELAMRLYDVLVPVLTERIGPANYLMYILYTDHTDGLFHRKRSSDALSVATRYRHHAESTGRRHPWLVDLAISQTAAQCKMHEEGGDVPGALRVLSSLFSYKMNADQQAGVNMQVGAYHHKLGNMPSAVGHYREAVRLAVQARADDRLLLASLANLERALRKMGRADESARVFHYRLQRIGGFARESNAISASSSPNSGVPALGSASGSWGAPPPGYASGAVYGTSPSSVASLDPAYDYPDWIWRTDSRSPDGSRRSSSTVMSASSGSVAPMLGSVLARTSPRSGEMAVTIPRPPGPPGSWQTLPLGGGHIQPPTLLFGHGATARREHDYPSPDSHSTWSSGHSPANYIPASHAPPGWSTHVAAYPPMEAPRRDSRGLFTDARRLSSPHGRYLDVPTSVADGR